MGILVKLTSADAAALAVRAAGAGQTPAEYAWRILKGDRPAVVPPINRIAWLRLAPLAGNLNQALFHANSAARFGETPDLQALPGLIREVRDILADLRAALMGEGAE